MATSSAFATAFNKEPAMAVAGIIALGALVLPYVVVPIRRSMGLPTYQWDADPKTHPVSCLSVFFYNFFHPKINSLTNIQFLTLTFSLPCL